MRIRIKAYEMSSIFRHQIAQPRVERKDINELPFWSPPHTKTEPPLAITGRASLSPDRNRVVFRVDCFGCRQKDKKEAIESMKSLAV